MQFYLGKCSKNLHNFIMLKIKAYDFLNEWRNAGGCKQIS